jgi:two-component system chemotaxis sensor kinase CheA
MPQTNASIEQVVVVKYEDKRVGVSVDAIIGEYQAVLKPLGKLYKNQDLISGATILGDGTIALVMDTNKMIKQFSKDSTIATI